jgi:hypothetical protein
MFLGLLDRNRTGARPTTALPPDLRVPLPNLQASGAGGGRFPVYGAHDRTCATAMLALATATTDAVVSTATTAMSNSGRRPGPCQRQCRTPVYWYTLDDRAERRRRWRPR